MNVLHLKNPLTKIGETRQCIYMDFFKQEFVWLYEPITNLKDEFIYTNKFQAKIPIKKSLKIIKPYLKPHKATYLK